LNTNEQETEKKQEIFVSTANDLRGQIIALHCILDVYLSQVLAEEYCHSNNKTDNHTRLRKISIIHSNHKNTFSKKIKLLNSLLVKTTGLNRKYSLTLISELKKINYVRNILSHSVIKTPSIPEQPNMVEFYNLKSIKGNSFEVVVYTFHELHLVASQMQAKVTELDSIRSWFNDPY
jgi:hypothetical protein